LYFAAALVWDTTGGGGSGAYAAWADGSYANYLIAAPELGTSGRYVATRPAGVDAAGFFEWVARGPALSPSTVYAAGERSPALDARGAVLLPLTPPAGYG